jgi:hypothetical protein
MFIFGLIGVAATLGVLRFGLSPSLFTTLHVTASTAAKFISVPLVGVALAAHFAPADIRTRMCESARARENRFHHLIHVLMMLGWVFASIDLGVHEEMVVFSSFLGCLATWVLFGLAFPIRGADILFGMKWQWHWHWRRQSL